MDGLTIERSEEAGGAALVLKLSGDMTIPWAGELRQTLLDAFDAAATVAVDVRQVASVDLSGLQLLCAAHRTSCVRGRAFRLTGERDGAFAEAVVLAGFPRHVGCARDVGKTCIWTGGSD
ncbi:STAS domain-containing protein [Geobacter pickeringii]|uniref:Sulfate transporter n=1 Tax=Geobacter pickeringii TaxID=345632 RepID=A0A0B5BFU6_9BACT|nr:STAS domain-containing protein [Geobacter pickeringii]AJE02931.1 sulfate transporter [Geobacter pickeringii]